MSERPRVLIVDDEHDIVRGLTVRLRAAGYEILTASNGSDGLEVATAALPDAILLDLRMPGLDGLDVLDALKRCDRTNRIPVIALSANVKEQVRSRAMTLGACCFVEKPFRTESLMSAMRDAVAAPCNAPSVGAVR